MLTTDSHMTTSDVVVVAAAVAISGFVVPIKCFKRKQFMTQLKDRSKNFKNLAES